MHHCNIKTSNAFIIENVCFYYISGVGHITLKGYISKPCAFNDSRKVPIRSSTHSLEIAILLLLLIFLGFYGAFAPRAGAEGEASLYRTETGALQ